MTFGKTLMKQFCYFFLQKSPLSSYKCVSIQSSIWILSRAQQLHSGTAGVGTRHVGEWPSVRQQLSLLHKRAEVFKLSCEYLHIYSLKSGNFCRKKYHNCMINVSPKVRFTENIKIQPEPRFRRYSMNTLNTYSHRPWAFVKCPSLSVNGIYLHVTMLQCWAKFSNVLVDWMICAKNYEIVSTFGKVMRRKLLASFFPDTVYTGTSIMIASPVSSLMHSCITFPTPLNSTEYFVI